MSDAIGDRLRRAVACPQRVATHVALDVGAKLLPTKHVSEPAWVLGGSSGRGYTDNSAALHRYLVRERPDLLTLWVIDTDAPDRDLAARFGPVVARRSLHTARQAHAAAVIAYSHGIHDVPGLRTARTPLVVELCHGPVVLKALPTRPPGSRRRFADFVDVAPVASELDRVGRRAQGFVDEQLPITGLARWDELLRARNSLDRQVQQPRILYAPTVRPWFDDSDLAPGGRLDPVRRLVTDPAVVRGVREGAFQLDVFIHQLTRERLGGFPWIPPELGQITDGWTLKQAIAQADLVITDYSSITWDALYLDIPTVFFHFDKPEYERRVHAHIDLAEDLPGPILTDPAEVAELVIADSPHFTPADLPQRRRHWQQQMFAYRDDQNCARVVSAIEERVT